MLHLLLLLLLGLASAFVRPVPWSIRRVPPSPGRAWILLLLLFLQMLLYELLQRPRDQMRLPVPSCVLIRMALGQFFFAFSYTWQDFLPHGGRCCTTSYHMSVYEKLTAAPNPSLFKYRRPLPNHFSSRAGLRRKRKKTLFVTFNEHLPGLAGGKVGHRRFQEHSSPCVASGGNIPCVFSALQCHAASGFATQVHMYLFSAPPVYCPHM